MCFKSASLYDVIAGLNVKAVFVVDTAMLDDLIDALAVVVELVLNGRSMVSFG
jgi:hypothetical protein